MSVRKLLVTRNDLRAMGLDVSNTQFSRWEEEGLLKPIKFGKHRSSVVRYRAVQVLRSILASRVQRVRPEED